MTDREDWLFAYVRQGTKVQIAATIRCVGCGKVLEILDKESSDGLMPDRGYYLPHWPFNEAGCPLCTYYPLEISASFLSKLPMKILERAIQIKKENE